MSAIAALQQTAGYLSPPLTLIRPRHSNPVAQTTPKRAGGNTTADMNLTDGRRIKSIRMQAGEKIRKRDRAPRKSDIGTCSVDPGRARRISQAAPCDDLGAKKPDFMPPFYHAS